MIFDKIGLIVREQQKKEKYVAVRKMLGSITINK